MLAVAVEKIDARQGDQNCFPLAGNHLCEPVDSEESHREWREKRRGESSKKLHLVAGWELHASSSEVLLLLMFSENEKANGPERNLLREAQGVWQDFCLRIFKLREVFYQIEFPESRFSTLSQFAMSQS